MSDAPVQVVVTDANVLINMLHVGRLEILGALPGFEFVIPDHVREEVTEQDQRARLDEAIARGTLRIESLREIPAISIFAELSAHLGRGEAACVALAATRRWMVASDEKRRFRREAEGRLGRDRLLTTPGIFVLAIRDGICLVPRRSRLHLARAEGPRRESTQDLYDATPQEKRLGGQGTWRRTRGWPLRHEGRGGGPCPGGRPKAGSVAGRNPRLERSVSDGIQLPEE